MWWLWVLMISNQQASSRQAKGRKAVACECNQEDLARRSAVTAVLSEIVKAGILPTLYY